jgi:hypothetical protein
LDRADNDVRAVKYGIGCKFIYGGKNRMAKIELAARTDSDRQHVLLELRLEGKPFGQISLSGSDAEQHIHMIAKHRAKLSDRVSRDLDPGSRLDAIYDPIWRTPTHRAATHGLLLALRHPGLGWLSFLLPHHEAAALGQWLIDHARPAVAEIEP